MNAVFAVKKRHHPAAHTPLRRFFMEPGRALAALNPIIGHLFTVRC